MKKLFLYTLLSIILMFGCVGCADQRTTTERYLELVDSPSTTLNNVWYNTGGIFRCAVFDSLVATEADMQTIKPALAEEFSRSEDGLQYEFVLRKNAKWHDGETLDAEDIVFSVKAMLRSNEVNGLLSSAFLYIDGAEDYKNGETEEISGITADGNVISIRLNSPVGDFLNAVAQFAILPEHLLGDVVLDEMEAHDYWTYPIGSGPYQITEILEEGGFILERNPSYYGSKPGIEKIRLKKTVEDSVAAMQDGTLDFYVTNDPAEIAKLKGVDNCSSHRLNILFPAYLIFNLSEDEGTHESLKDVRVRKALLMAIDREMLVEAIFPGSTVSDTLIPAWDNWYLSDGEQYEFSPDRAKELLKEAGFDFMKPIRLRYFTKGQSTADLMSAIAVYWRAIGIKVELEMFEGSGSKHMFETRDYDICYKRLSAFNHAAIYKELEESGVMQNSIYHLPVYDELIGRLDIALDDASRKEIVNEMQFLDQEYMLRMPLFALANVAYVNESHFQMPEAYGNLWYRYDLCFEDWKLVD